MAWKVANYNSLRQEISTLRSRYQHLQKDASQTQEQLATLQLFAREISVAYGIKQRLEGPGDISREGRLVPTFQESIEEYRYLRNVNFAMAYRKYPKLWQTNVIPNLWPVEGRLQSHWGDRVDPFSGEGTFHPGVDISAPIGTPVRASADGFVAFADPMSGYGRLVIIDHGNGFRTYYAHLSKFSVIPGQEVRRGEIIGAVGISGRTTAPHLHYEVRRGGSAVNPYTYLSKAPTVQAVKRDLPF